MLTQPSDKAGEYYASRVLSDVAQFMDPNLLQRYYQTCARVQTKRINHKLELITKEEADNTH